MNKSELKRAYPSLFNVLSEVWMDWGGGLSGWTPEFPETVALPDGDTSGARFEEFPEYRKTYTTEVTLQELEIEASGLSRVDLTMDPTNLQFGPYESDVVLISSGEDGDACKAVRHFKVYKLVHFLNECFDGELNKCFWGED